jgi:hypothetical protein
MNHFEVYLKSTSTPVPVEAENYFCEKDSQTVFYTGGDEVARFGSENVRNIERLVPLVYPKT